ERRLVDLLEGLFNYRSNTVFHQSRTCHIRRRAVKTFDMCHLEQTEAKLLQIRRMPHPPQRKPVVDLVEFRSSLAHRRQKNASVIGQRDNRTPLLELIVEILSPIADRFYPAIGLFIHSAPPVIHRGVSTSHPALSAHRPRQST